MRVILQRVLTASVTINSQEKSAIEQGLLLLVGFTENDTQEDINWMVKKVIQLRVFDDEQKIPNLSLQETGGEILSISQFTLFAQTKKGNRPSYIRAAKPEQANPLYNKFKKNIFFPHLVNNFANSIQVLLTNVTHKFVHILLIFLCLLCGLKRYFRCLTKIDRIKLTP